MADTDFYKAEIERQQERHRDWHRVWLEACGLLPKLGVDRDLENMTPQDVVRLAFDRAQSLVIAYKQEVAERMYVQGALDELISAANVQLSEAWVDVSDGCGEDCTEFSLYQSAVPRLVTYLKQRACCGDARCHNQDSGVECKAGSP